MLDAVMFNKVSSDRSIRRSYFSRLVHDLKSVIVSREDSFGIFNRRLEFQKRSQLFIRSYDETLSVAAVRA